MSINSQSEQIWQYAMRGGPFHPGTKDSSVNGTGIVDLLIDGNTAEFSDEFSIPSKLELHGLGETQTMCNPSAVDGLEHLSNQSTAALSHSTLTPRISTLLDQSAAVEALHEHVSGVGSGGEAVSEDHVTDRVRSAPPPVVPFVEVSVSNITPFHADVVTRPPTEDVSSRFKAVSFDNAPRPPRSPPNLPRNYTMPTARPNRYAPRDIERSSQDSLADPISQDLTSYIKNVKPPPTKSTRTRKLSPPTSTARQPESSSNKWPVDASDSLNEESMELQCLGATHLLSSPPLQPGPLVLVKDSQSQPQSQDSGKSGDVNTDDMPSSSKQVEEDLDGDVDDNQPARQPLSPTVSLISSSSSFALPHEGIVEATQSQPVTAPEPSPSLYKPNMGPHSIIANAHGSARSELASPSPFPIPSYRKKELKLVQNAFRRGPGDEVVPETPASAGVRRIIDSHASAQCQWPVKSNLMLENIQPQAHAENGQSHSIEPSTAALHDKGPSSQTKHDEKKVAAYIPAGRPRSSDAAKAEPGCSTRVSPRHSSHHNPISKLDKPLMTAPSRQSPRRGPRPGDYVPDSQEEAQLTSKVIPPSSPSIPLHEVVASSTGTGLRPPTPTPTDVKSTLRRGEVSEHAAHTRGGGWPSSAKGKGKAGEIEYEESEGPQAGHSETRAAMEDEGDETGPEPQLALVEEKVSSRRRRGASHPKQKTAKLTHKRETRATRAISGTDLAVANKPALHSKKRRSDGQDELSSERAGTRELSIPPKKRQRSSWNATTSLKPGNSSVRVFARRPGSGGSMGTTFYLPATLLVDESLSDFSAMNAFVVRFGDDVEKEVDVADMRQFDLHIGDMVYFLNKEYVHTRAEVLDTESWRIDETIQVHDLGSGVDGDDLDLHSSNVKIAEDDIYAQWKARCVSSRTLFKDRSFPAPPLNNSLAGMAFIVTLPDLPKTKRSLVKLIEASGGLLYDDWSSVISLGGTMEVGGKRMVSKSPEMKIGKESRKVLPAPNMVFCVSDEPRTTPKFLIALALGVPCISMEWVIERASGVQNENDRLVNWQAYILPAGQNPFLRLMASQAFNRIWWKEGEDHLSRLLANPPVLKPFEGKRFLCVGSPDFCFPNKEFGTFPKLLLAMGALHVQSVVDVKFVKVKDGEMFDYTVVDDGSTVVTYSNSVPVNATWIKRCLLAGCELP